MTATNGSGQSADHPTEVTATIELRPGQTLVPRAGGSIYLDIAMRVSDAPPRERRERLPLRLGLVLDRSGTMHGSKLDTAKYAASAVLDKLDTRDTVAVVVFDEQIDTIQTAAPATQATKDAIRAALARIESRGRTALHEGWLTGCTAIAEESLPTADHVCHCFLLTDGLANVGQTDPEAIASEVGTVRARTGIGTSTFGIGDDYAEDLLGPMAVSGGGQFHHLRAPDEIARTFIGQVGDMLAIALTQARIELDLPSGASAEVISAYWTQAQARGATGRVISVGDLLASEQRHITLRLDLPPQDGPNVLRLRARICWSVEANERSSAWQGVSLTYADDAAVAGQPADSAVMALSLRDIADRTQLRAITASRRGQAAQARLIISEAIHQLEPLPMQLAPEVAAELDSLRQLSAELASGQPAPGDAKQRYFEAQRRSRGQRDYRGDVR